MPVETEWQVGRLEARGRGGMVAAKTALAVEAGADVLRLGGNAVDAAVTTVRERFNCKVLTSGCKG